jgi:predicted nucleic acid-binding protein
MSSCGFCEAIRTMIFVDTNVLIDVAANNPIWVKWSRDELNAADLTDELVINDTVYAELAVGYPRIDEVDAFIRRSKISVRRTPKPALFLAGKAFQHYRASGGTRTGVLSNFFIGAHAVSTNSRLITRDPRRYRTYFPGIELITPSEN